MAGVRPEAQTSDVGKRKNRRIEKRMEQERTAGRRDPEGGHAADRQNKLHLPLDRLRREDEEA